MLLFFLPQNQRSLSVTNPASILTIFEKDMNWCAYAYTNKKFTNFCAGVFQAQNS